MKPPDILTFINTLPNEAIRKRELEDALSSYEPGVDTKMAIQSLLKKKLMRTIEVPGTRRPVALYFRPPMPLEFAVTFTEPGAYLCHGSALALHGLAKSTNCIYVNAEQGSGSSAIGQLTQDRIDQAFRKGPRITNNRLVVDTTEVVLVSSKNSMGLGITKVNITRRQHQYAVATTSVERTLVDVTVRPFYAGGPNAVLRAYQKGGRLDVSRLADILVRLGHTYPYHQAIGFYLEKTGLYDPESLWPLRRLPMEFDFYLTYGITNPVYVPDWRIHVPPELAA